jgi:polar amino acid transport system substrate-binding protein
MKFAFLIEPPFCFLDSMNEPTGCDVDLARHVFRELGVEDVHFIETQFSQLLPGLADGRWDMTTGLFDTVERRQSVSFSRPIWALPDGLLVRVGNPKGFDGYRSIAADPLARLAVIRDQVQQLSAMALGVRENQLRIFDTYNEAAEAVRVSAADAYASVARAHLGFIAANPGAGLACSPVPSDEKEPAPGALAFRKEDNGLRAAVDSVLAAYLGSAAHRKAMGRYGFGASEIDLAASAG